MKVSLDHGADTSVTCQFGAGTFVGQMLSNSVVCNTSTLAPGSYEASVILFGSSFLMGRLVVLEWSSSQKDSILTITRTTQ